jgi:integrase
MKIELVESLAPVMNLPVEDKAYIAWDAGWPHTGSRLGFRILPSGVRSAIVKCRVGPKNRKRQTTITLGKMDLIRQRRLTISQLRTLAKEKVDEAKGAGLTAGQLGDREARNNVAIAEIGREYIAQRMAGNKPYKDGGAAALKQIERAAAVWGMKPVAALTAADGAALLEHVVEIARTGKDRKARAGRGVNHNSSVPHKENPGHSAAQKARGLLKPVLKYANDALEGVTVKAGIMDHFALKTNAPKSVVLHWDQVDRLFEAVALFETTAPNNNGEGGGGSPEARADTAALVRLQYATAARPQDWRQAQWRDVQLDGEMPYALFSAHKRKQGKDFRQRLPANVVKILKGIRDRRPSEGWGVGPEDFIFPSRASKTGHRVTLGGAWDTIVEMAGLGGLKGLTPHVLRASRITELKDRFDWSFEQIATFMGNTPDVIERIYYRPRWDGQDLDLSIMEAEDASRF